MVLQRAPDDITMAEDTATEQSAVVAHEYWEVWEKETSDLLTLFLLLFCPTCGKVSKKKSDKWDHIKQNVLPRICSTKASFTAKVKLY